MIEQSQYLLTVHQVEMRHGFSSFTPHKGHIPFDYLFEIAPENWSLESFSICRR